MDTTTAMACDGNSSVVAYSNEQNKRYAYCVYKLDLRGAVPFRFNFGAVILQLFESSCSRSKKPVEPEEEEDEEAKRLFKILKVNIGSWSSGCLMGTSWHIHAMLCQVVEESESESEAFVECRFRTVSVHCGLPPQLAIAGRR